MEVNNGKLLKERRKYNNNMLQIWKKWIITKIDQLLPRNLNDKRLQERRHWNLQSIMYQDPDRKLRSYKSNKSKRSNKSSNNMNKTNRTSSSKNTKTNNKSSLVMHKMFRIIMIINIINSNSMTKIKTPMMEAPAEEVR